MCVVWVGMNRGQSGSSAVSAPHCATLRLCAAMRCSDAVQRCSELGREWTGRGWVKVVSRRGTIAESIGRWQMPAQSWELESWNPGILGRSSESSNKPSPELFSEGRV